MNATEGKPSQISRILVGVSAWRYYYYYVHGAVYYLTRVVYYSNEGSILFRWGSSTKSSTKSESSTPFEWGTSILFEWNGIVLRWASILFGWNSTTIRKQ